jgi:threonine dehydrogenase-like Zn-dependent dehydrogenase
MGFGSGEGAYFIATNVAKECNIIAVDISTENLRLAQALFGHPRIDYRKADVISEPIEGKWDVIVLPDVYEHIPVQSRNLLHTKLNELLEPKGRILLTVPSPGKQASLYASGEGLQIVDEIVTLENLVVMATAVGGVLSYFNMISVWETNDYIQAVIERGVGSVTNITDSDKTPLKGWPRRKVWAKGFDFLGNRLRLFELYQAIQRKRINNRLRREANK